MMMTNIVPSGDVVETVDAQERSHGTRAALELAMELLSQEMTVLQWRPATGVALGRWITKREGVSASLLHAVTSYIALYYPELDDAIAEIQTLLAAGRTADAHRMLDASLDALEP